jgi:hypothetical protein
VENGHLHPPSGGRAQATPGEQNGQPCQAAKCGKISTSPARYGRRFKQVRYVRIRPGAVGRVLRPFPSRAVGTSSLSPASGPIREVKTTRALRDLRRWRNNPTRRAVRRLRARESEPMSGYPPGFTRSARGTPPGGPGELGEAWPPNQEALRAGVPAPKVVRFERDAPSHRPTRVTSGKTVGSSRARGFESHPTAVTLAIPL